MTCSVTVQVVLVVQTSLAQGRVCTLGLCGLGCASKAPDGRLERCMQACSHWEGRTTFFSSCAAVRSQGSHLRSSHVGQRHGHAGSTCTVVRSQGTNLLCSISVWRPAQEAIARCSPSQDAALSSALPCLAHACPLPTPSRCCYVRRICTTALSAALKQPRRRGPPPRHRGLQVRAQVQAGRHWGGRVQCYV